MNAAELNAKHEKARNCKHGVYTITDGYKLKCDNCGHDGRLKWDQLLPREMEFVDTDDTPMGMVLQMKGE